MQTFAFLFKLAKAGVQDAHVYPLGPYPGSEIFDELKRKGFITLDEYFFDITFTHLGSTKSYSDHFSDRALVVLSLLGMAMFYSVSFLIRPKRLWTLIINTLKKTPTTKLESALVRIREKKHAYSLSREL